MKTRYKIRNIAAKIIAMMVSTMYLILSANVPVLAQNEPGPITGGTYDGDVEVTAGQVPNYTNYMAGVSATDNNTKVSVGNNLSVTSDTGSTVTGVYVTGADAEVSVGKDLSVVSESTNTRGIDAQPNANTAAVTIGNDLTVDSRNTMYTAIGIEARPAAGATADITVGNSDTNQGYVTVSGTQEVRGISIAVNNTGGSSQGNTNITVGGDVTSSISESNDSASGVYLNTIAGTITNVNIGGAVKANGNTKAMGLDIHPSGNNTNEIDVGKGISASAAKATGVFLLATNTSNTTINIGKDSSGNAITVHSNGDNNDQAFSSGISAQLHTGEGFTGSTTATINVEGNIVVSSEAAGARGIYADGGDRTNLNVQVKGDVTSNGAGIYTTDMSSAESTDIIIDGTVKSTADGIPAVILDDSSINNGQVSITAWKIESNEGTALFGKNDGAEIQKNDNSQNAVASHISYIIRVTQPEIGGTSTNVISLVKENGDSWDKNKEWDNGEGAAPTKLDVANENETVYVKLDIPDGYELVGVYADAEKTVALSQDENGSYYLDVPRSGGINVNVDLTNKSGSSGGDTPASGGDTPASGGDTPAKPGSPAINTNTVTGGFVTVGENSFPVSATVTYTNTYEYTGGAISPSKKLGATVDRSSLISAASSAMTKTGKDAAKLFKVSYRVKNNKNAGTGRFYAEITFDSKKAKSWGIKGQALKDLKAAVKQINKQFKSQKQTFTITPVNLKTSFSSVKGSFTKKGKLKLSWIKVNVGGKPKKITTKQYKIIDKNPEAGTFTIEGKGKNFTGSLVITLP